jgi:hypothetical protein
MWNLCIFTLGKQFVLINILKAFAALSLVYELLKCSPKHIFAKMKNDNFGLTLIRYSQGTLGVFTYP